MNDALKVKHLIEALAWCMRQLDSMAIQEMAKKTEGPLTKEKFEEKFPLYRYTSAKNAELVLGEVGAKEELINARANLLITIRDNARVDVQAGPVQKGG